MTSQMADFFEYREQEHCLIGFTGGHLTNAWDFGMSFRGASTADARGFCMIYGIDQESRLVIKRIEIRGVEIDPIKHNYQSVRDGDAREFYDNINQVIPITGYLLFSPNVWTVSHLYLDTIDPYGSKYQLFEATVDEGAVTEVRDCADEVRQNLRSHSQGEFTGLWSGNTDEERLSNLERIWNVTASFLPHRYDNLYIGIWYFSFPEQIEELRRKLSSSDQHESG